MNSVALVTKPFVDHFPYELSNSFCGDETYIRVKGRWHYLFFFFDAVKKIILSYPVSPNRDTLSPIKPLARVFQNFKEILEDLLFLFVVIPIFILAHLAFPRLAIHFVFLKLIG